MMDINNKKIKPRSMFIGRYQPFHDGHKELIETVLKKGDDVLVAVRDTEINNDNPYSVEQRIIMIQKALQKWCPGRVRVIAIPDIHEVCYGRDVGYDIRCIEMPADIEAISATNIRKNST